jgi:hypothetical protein
VQAIRAISHDPTLRETITLKDGRTLTALQIQLEYLEYATRYVDSISPDPATKDVLARWTDVLMKLESDPMQLSRELDWVIKKAWIDQFMDRHRLSWRDPKVSLLDLQYHDIRPEKGVYYRLALNDQVDRITNDETIEQAKHGPPQTTRAHISCRKAWRSSRVCLLRSRCSLLRRRPSRAYLAHRTPRRRAPSRRSGKKYSASWPSMESRRSTRTSPDWLHSRALAGPGFQILDWSKTGAEGATRPAPSLMTEAGTRGVFRLEVREPLLGEQSTQDAFDHRLCQHAVRYAIRPIID